MGVDYYNILKVPKTFTHEELLNSYKKLAMKWHPDKTKSSDDSEFKQISEAYYVLSDPKKRQIYDLYGEEGLKSDQVDDMDDVDCIPVLESETGTMAGSVFKPYISGESGCYFAGVYQRDLDDEVTNATRNLITGDRFHSNDIVHPILEVRPDSTCRMAEMRVLNPSYSKLAAAIALNIQYIPVIPGAKVLYIADETCGIELSHLSDMVGEDGRIYVVGQHEMIRDVFDEFGCLEDRSNIRYLRATSNYPLAYKELIRKVNVIISDVDHIHQIESLALNAKTIMEEGGKFIIFIKAHVTAHLSYLHNGAIVPSIALFKSDIRKLEEYQFKILRGITLAPYMDNYGCIVGSYPL